MTRPYQQTCVLCQKRTVDEVILNPYEFETEHEGQHYELSVPNLKVFQCSACGEIVLDDDATDAMFVVAWKAFGKLMPDEIKNCRQILGFDRVALAKSLGVTEGRVAGWENGNWIPTREMDRQVRAMLEGACSTI